MVPKSQNQVEANHLRRPRVAGGNGKFPGFAQPLHEGRHLGAAGTTVFPRRFGGRRGLKPGLRRGLRLATRTLLQTGRSGRGHVPTASSPEAVPAHLGSPHPRVHGTPLVTSFIPALRAGRTNVIEQAVVSHVQPGPGLASGRALGLSPFSEVEQPPTAAVFASEADPPDGNAPPVEMNRFLSVAKEMILLILAR